jgi:hypothetical protein
MNEIDDLASQETAPPSYESPENAEGEASTESISRIMNATDFIPTDSSLIFQLSFYFENNKLFLVVKTDSKEENYQILSDDQKTFDLLAEKIAPSVDRLYEIFPKKADYKKAKKEIKKAQNK